MCLCRFVFKTLTNVNDYSLSKSAYLNALGTFRLTVKHWIVQINFGWSSSLVLCSVLNSALDAKIALNWV